MKKKLLAIFMICLFAWNIAEAGLEEVLAYEHACTELTETYPAVNYCRAIDFPLVIYTKLIYKLGSDGMYVKGEPFVFVHPRAPDRTRVLVHELAHYIMYETGVDRGMTTCDMEKAVRRVAGHPWGTAEKKMYGCLKG